MNWKYFFSYVYVLFAMEISQKRVPSALSWKAGSDSKRTTDAQLAALSEEDRDMLLRNAPQQEGRVLDLNPIDAGRYNFARIGIVISIAFNNATFHCLC